MLNPNIQERATNFLIAKLKELDAATSALLAEGKLKVYSKKHYIRGEVLSTDAGNIVIGFGANQKQLRGVCSYANGKLNKGEYFALVGLGIGYTFSAGLGAIGTNNADLLDYARAGIYSPYTLTPATLVQNVPTGLVNKDLEISVGSLEVYEGPLSPFFIRGGAGQMNTSNNDHIVELEAPKLISPEEFISIQVKGEAGVAIGAHPVTAAARQFVEVTFYGVGFKKI